jgi:Fe2+ transport system protein FeoA
MLPSPENCSVLPLQFLAPGQPACVDEVLGEPADVNRLAELGLKPGVAIEMVQPGNPCIVRLAGSKLCFRETDLLSVLVRLGEAA